jgi:ribosome-associated protein YbcJ (S4-like RNA binding protein)
MGAKYTQAKKEYIEGYLKDNTKNYNFRFSKIYDDDIIEFMETQKNKCGFVKELIREHMRKHKIKVNE